MSRDAERQRAKALKAADARDLIKPSLPFVLQQMTPVQLDQVQRVLDAAVVNPAVQKEVDDLNRKSIIAQSGALTNRDPAMVRRAQQAEGNFIPIKEADKHVRLDFQKLLAANALKPTTDNPDEAAYLIEVNEILGNKGIWLRFDSKLVQDPADPSRRIPDYRTFEAWLSLGYDGQSIPTAGGHLTRDALLSTQVLGAGYYDAVHKGPTQMLLSKAINHITSNIETGRQQHSELAKVRRHAAPGVNMVSDALGGADFPDEKIWEAPRQIVLKAMNLNVGGNVKQSSKVVIIAAVTTHVAAKLQSKYIDDYSLGAERAVKVLKVLKTAGKIAETVLIVRTVGMGLVRLAGRKLAEAGAEAGAEAAVTGAGESAGAATRGAGAARAGAIRPAPPVTRSPVAFAQTNLRVGREVYARTVAKAGVTMDTGAGMAIDRYAVGDQVLNEQKLAELVGGMEELTLRGASFEEKLAFMDRYNAKWGLPP